MAITQSPLPGFGIAVTFQSGFFAYITSVSHNGISRQSLDISHNAIADSAMLFTASKLADWGSYDVEFWFKSDQTPPIDSAAETVTLTFPKPSGATTAATWAGSAFMTDYSWSGPHDGVMSGSATLKLAAKPTITAAT